jgi:GNAT superfamily N-acetyltransferase
MSRQIVVTYLEITDPAQLRPAKPPRVEDVAIERVVPPDGAVSRWFYVEVGTPHFWVDRLGHGAAEWQAHADQVETWVATVGGERAGYAELKPEGDTVWIAYFGLLRAFQAAGLGGHLLTHAIRRGFELAPAVRVHTCTLDGPHALANYEARGMRPYHQRMGWNAAATPEG